jgi:hypothetical protein
MRITRSNTRRTGQALAEFALVFPFFFLLFMSVVIVGLYVFNNQQLENAARETARFAAVHSTGSLCPTVSRLDPIPSLGQGPPFRCDAPEGGWPFMSGVARSNVWGLKASQVGVSACWSGYVDAANNSDAPPIAGNTFTPCTINRVNPRTSPDSIPCPPPPTIGAANPNKADGDDKASAIASGNGIAYPTTVTVFLCYNWSPPLAGLLFVPSTITMRAVITEAMQRQEGE